MRRLERIARDLGLTLPTLALAYLTYQPFPTFLSAASSTKEQLAENLRAGDVVLTPDALLELETRIAL